MNRHDEIQAKARDIASNIHADPVARDAMADDLIKLIGMMIGATGKYLAVEGEGQMNDAVDQEFELDSMSIDYSVEEEAELRAEFEADQARDVAQYGTMYLTGGQIQSDIHKIVVKCTNPKVDLDRYHRVTGNEWCVCGHHPDSHKTNEHGSYCAGVLDNKQACMGGTCPGFRAKLREPVWTHVDRRPKSLRADENLRAPGKLPTRCESVGKLGYRCTWPTGHPGEHRAEWTRWL